MNSEPAGVNLHIALRLPWLCVMAGRNNLAPCDGSLQGQIDWPSSGCRRAGSRGHGAPAHCNLERLVATTVNVKS